MNGCVHSRPRLTVLSRLHTFSVAMAVGGLNAAMHLPVLCCSAVVNTSPLLEEWNDAVSVIVSTLIASLKLCVGSGSWGR